MRADRVLPETQPCPNCGDPTPGNYCPACGQRRVARVLSLRRLVMDAVEDQFSVNAALPRTLAVLFTHPGLLTQEFLRGRIASYIPPFRLYLLTSFVFFLSIAIFGCEEDDGPQVQLSARAPGDTAGNVRLIRTDTGTASADTAAPAVEPDIESDTAIVALADSAAARERRRVLNRERNSRRLRQELDDFFAKYALPYEDVLRERMYVRGVLMQDLGEDFNQLMLRELRARAPVVIFLLVPVFTAIMKLLYIRQRRFYVEHFVFALHLHSFLFFSLTLLLLLPRWWAFNVFLSLWLVSYIFLSMRRVYQQSKLMTLLKYFVLAITYFVLALIALLGTVLFTFFFAPV